MEKTSQMNYYPLPHENLIGQIGDYWLEGGEVKYKEGELKDVSPSGSLYSNHEWVTTVKVLVNPPESLIRRLMLAKRGDRLVRFDLVLPVPIPKLHQSYEPKPGSKPFAAFFGHLWYH